MEKKIGIIGAGNVGGELAFLLASRALADIVLLDLPENDGLVTGKAMDISHAVAMMAPGVRVSGTTDWSAVRGADLLIITVGKPRKPGQTRDSLLGVNMPIIHSVAESARAYCADSFSIVLSNPLDTMVYEYWRVSGFAHNRVVGMAGILDSARFKHYVAQELAVDPSEVEGLILGSHGDGMVPVLSSATCAGVPIVNLLTRDRLDAIVERTRNTGSELVSRLGTSAYYAAAASTASIVESYLLDQKLVLPCAAYLDGEYNERGIFAGVPVVIGAAGVERVVSVPLSETERRQFGSSVGAIRATIEALGGLSS